jgi:uncharacterized protein (DUF1778 family)
VTSNERLDMRLPAETKEMIERAASLAGVSLSAFVVSAARDAAIKVIEQHETWRLNRRDSKAFVDAVRIADDA